MYIYIYTVLYLFKSSSCAPGHPPFHHDTQDSASAAAPLRGRNLQETIAELYGSQLQVHFTQGDQVLECKILELNGGELRAKLVNTKILK